jgi:hypothetical protein
MDDNNNNNNNNNNNESQKEKCINAVIGLFNKYADNQYMLQRIHNHVVNYLPKILNNEDKIHETRVSRNNYLTNEQQIFIQVFLSKNKYYYLPNNNFFYEYNGKNVFIIKEDTIIHKLLSTISNDRTLLQWKYKTKINIIKLIKERNLFQSIPETHTIQNVLNVLYPTIFYSKNAAKYFLTIIGDNILKKNTQHIFLVTTKMRQFLNELNDVAIASIGNNNISNNFVTKYHENHSYENCRLIRINENYSNELWREILKKIGLDLLCVAAHYSNRHENSDKFINIKADEEIKIYAYYLKNNAQKEIIGQFCKEYMVEEPGTFIEWKHIHFVWKYFLSNFHLPNIIYSNSFKNLLKEKYNYDEEQDSFIGITSMYIPIQNDFIRFWAATISCNETSNSDIIFIDEMEVDELCSLFKLWSKTTTEPLLTNGNISEENMLKIIKHFFPQVTVLEDKYILNVCCSLWKKEIDIQKSFEYIKQELNKNIMIKLISFDELYKYYNRYCTNNYIKLIVSKRYFEKYLVYKFGKYIEYDNFVTIVNFCLFHK